MKLTKEQLNLRTSEYVNGSRTDTELSAMECVDGITDFLNILHILTEFNNGDDVSIDRLHKIVVGFSMIDENIILGTDMSLLLHIYTESLFTRELDMNYEGLCAQRGFFIDNKELRKAFIYQYLHEMCASRFTPFPSDYAYRRADNYNQLTAIQGKLLALYNELRNYLITEALPIILQKKSVAIRFREYNDKILQTFGIDGYPYFRDYLKE